MACIRRLYGHWRKNWHCFGHDPQILYLYFFSYHGLATDHLPVRCILDECKKIHHQCQEESVEVLVMLDAGY